MYSLLLDSSNKSLSVGIGSDHVMVDEISYDAWQKQSELLVDEIGKMLKKHQIARKDIGEVVVSKGPGSYTGVRIAMAVAKTIVFALGIPLYLVSSLEAMKIGEKPTICLMNARSKRSYIGVYEGDKCLMADTVLSNEDVLEYIKANPSFVLSGELIQLGLSDQQTDVLVNLLKGDSKENLCKEPLAAKPVYLKDSYPI